MTKKLSESRPKATDKRTINWNPQPGPQTAFFESPAFELLYGGAAGGGKSEALLFESIAMCIRYENYKAILFRRTYPELANSLVLRATSLLYGYAKSRDKGMRWEFPNGSVLYFSHLQREEDKEKHKSAEYDYIGFDELTSFTETQYTYLFSRCRGATQVPRKIRSATNPTGIGHAWVKRRFLQPSKEEAVPIGSVSYDFAYGWLYRGHAYTSFNDLPDNYADGEPAFSEERYNVYKELKSGLTRAYIPALLWANAALIKGDPTYAKKVSALPEKQQQALLYGRWDVFEGQYFASFDPDVHVVKPFDIPDTWRKYRGIDYGYTAPFACVWIAVDHEGNLIVYRELYQAKMTPDEQARAVLMLTGDEKIEWTAADPSMFSRGTGYGESKADIYTRHGLDILASNNDRVAGWALLHQAFQNNTIKIFDSCPNLIRTIPLLTHSFRNVEDLNSDQEDHLIDSARYLLLTLKGAKTRNIDDSAPPTKPEWWYNKVEPRLRARRAFTLH